MQKCNSLICLEELGDLGSEWSGLDTNVFGIATLTNQQLKSTIKDLEKIISQQTLQRWMSNQSPLTKCSAQVSLVKHSLLQEKGKGLMIQEERFFSRFCGSQDIISQNTFSSKMLRDYYQLARLLFLTVKRDNPKESRLRDIISSVSWNPWENWGMMSNGRFSTARTSVSPKIGKECSLLDILEEKVDKKYYLSKKGIERILKGGMRNHNKSIVGTLTANMHKQNWQTPTINVLNFRYDEGSTINDGIISPTITQHNFGISSDCLIIHNLQPRTGNPKKGGIGHLSKNNNESYCLDTNNSMAIEFQGKIRRLTPIECERLQSYPDNWTKELANSNRYKTLGNAVTVNVIEEIAKNFK